MQHARYAATSSRRGTRPSRRSAIRDRADAVLGSAPEVWRVKRTLIAIMVASSISTLLVLGAEPARASGRGDCSSHKLETSAGMTYEQRAPKVKALIRCVFTAVGIPNEIPHAIAIAYRESRFNRFAYNPSGATGIYQHLRRYWPSRAYTWAGRSRFPAWPNLHATNQRANVWVTARMVRAGGWGPWGG